MARSFVAGPYRVASESVDGRQYRVYLLGDGSHDPRRLVSRLARAIAVEASRFGPFPAPSYGIAELPRIPEQAFGAVSEQTFLVVQPPNLDHVDSNIQLFAHEAAHTWWGNAVATSGPGLKWCSEGLAELGALLAMEALDGERAARDFLEFSALGTDPAYSAAGHFALLRQGQDLPLAPIEYEPQSHALANSKGAWVFHMLRELIGDDAFFDVLRRTASELRGRTLTVDELRRRFAQAAPGKPVAAFFAQWLDRTGAPVLDVFWHANAEGNRALIEIRQTQPGEPFSFDLDLRIALADGTAKSERLRIERASQVFEIETAARPLAVDLDPERRLLMWHPAYGPPPGRELVGASAKVPEAIASVVVGTYRFVGMNKRAEVFVRDGVLFMQVEDSAPVRLLHDGGGAFRVDAPGGMRVEFDLDPAPARSFVSIEGGGSERYPAERIPRQ